MGVWLVTFILNGMIIRSYVTVFNYYRDNHITGCLNGLSPKRK